MICVITILSRNNFRWQVLAVAFLLSSLLPCPTEGQTVIYLSVLQEPNLVISAGSDQTITKGQSVAIGGNPSAQLGYLPYAYLWTPTNGLSNPTAANPTASPDTTTIYQLTVTDGKNCTEVDEVMVTVTPSSGVDTHSNWELEVYPNPVTDKLTVSITGLTGIIRLRLLNTLGRLVLDKEYQGVTTISDQIDMSTLPPGMYSIHIGSEQIIINRIIIKQ